MLTFQTFTTLLATMAARVQGACSTLVDLTVGSLVRSILESAASVQLWLQYLILTVAALTRAATSAGANLDSWMADFSFYRLLGSIASGQVTFSRFTYTASALVPAGTNVLTIDGTQTFTVTVDTTNSLWNAGLNGYLIPAGTQTATLPVAALVVGTVGNVLANTITQIASPLSGIDTCTNANPFTNGTNSETDAAFRARFAAYINTRSQATIAAILAAVDAVQSGLIAAVFENVSSNAAYLQGNFTVIVDDGSGTPNGTLLTNVQAAVDPVRPIGSTFGVAGPNVTTATIVIVSSPPSGVSAGSYTAAVQAAVVAYIAGLAIGATLIYSQIAIVASGAAPTGTTFPTVTLNGGSANLPPIGPITGIGSFNMGAIRAGTVTVS